ncbi:UNVERIFIED_CONTAM: hypothetical protein K2H54_021406 [Gekko kuhli]
MSLSSFEVAMETMASVVSCYLKDKNGVPMISKDGLNQLVKEQFPHCEKDEISPGVYEIRIPLASSPTVEGTTSGCMELDVVIQAKKLKQAKRDDADSQDFRNFQEGEDDEAEVVDFDEFIRIVSHVLIRVL